MKFSLSWLKEHLNTDATIDQVAQRLTQIGLEVEGIDNPAEKLAAFRIAKVLSAAPRMAIGLSRCLYRSKQGLAGRRCG